MHWRCEMEHLTTAQVLRSRRSRDQFVREAHNAGLVHVVEAQAGLRNTLNWLLGNAKVYRVGRDEGADRWLYCFADYQVAFEFRMHW